MFGWRGAVEMPILSIHEIGGRPGEDWASSGVSWEDVRDDTDLYAIRWRPE
jgi:hypothetical protein